MSSISWLHIEKAFQAFWRLTDTESHEARTLRALILHMLKSHGKLTFVRLELEPRLQDAISNLASIPTDLSIQLDPDELQARVDAWYLSHLYGRPTDPLDEGMIRTVLQYLERDGDEIYAWIIATMIERFSPQCFGIDAPQFDEPLIDLYVQTHEVLFASDYLLHRDKTLGSTIDRLARGTDFVQAHRHIDLAAEIAICFQHTGTYPAHAHRLLDLVTSAQEDDGEISDHSMPAPAEEMADHATGVALVALAGAKELEDHQTI